MSEILNLPDGWEIKPLQSIGTCKNGLTYSPDDIVENGGLLVLRSSNIQNSQITLEDNVFVREDINLNYKVQENDILVCVRNGSKDLIGKNALITKEVENMAHGAFMTVFHSNINKYVFQLFQSDLFFKQVEKNLGATINSINNSDLLLFEFPFPKEKQEQEKIAKILSTLDKAIESTNLLIEKEKSIKIALIQELLTNGIDENGQIRTSVTHSYKPSELGLIPDDWEIKKIEDVSDVFGGGTPDRSNNDFWENGTIFWATPTDITAISNSNYLGDTKEKITEKGLLGSSAKLLPVGSILLTSRATIGERKISKVPVCTNQGFTSLVPKKDNGVFIYYLFDKYIDYMYSRAYGTTFPEISRTEVKNMHIALPKDESEQKRIDKILSTQDKKIQIEETNLIKLKELKKGLMNDLLSGRVRVKV